MTNCDYCGRQLYPWNDTGQCIEPKMCRLVPGIDGRYLPWKRYINQRSLYFVPPEMVASKDWWLADD